MSAPVVILYAGADGRLLRVAQPGLDPEPPEAPEGTVVERTLDRDTNAALRWELVQHGDRYRLTAAGLTKDGQPVTIAADGPQRTIEQRLEAALAESRQIVTAAESYQPLAANATAADVRAHLITHLPRIYQGLARLARHDIGEIRLLLNQLDGTD